MSTTTRRAAAPAKNAGESKPAAACGTSAETQQAPKQTRAINPERIRARAYEIFRERNARPGDAVSDWLQAEREINAAPCKRSECPRMCGTLSEHQGQAECRGALLLNDPD